MSSLLFPTLQGITWPVGRDVSWKTLTSETAGRMAAVALQQYPTYTWTFTYDVLRDDIAVSDLKAIVGLFNACRGRYDSFLYSDPLFNSVVASNFGTGNGANKDFQVTAFFQNTNGAGIAEVIQNFNGLPNIFVNGVLKTNITDYSIGPTGIISFVVAPANGVPITWTGSFYYRCNFLNDTLDVSEFSYQWWSTKDLKFRSRLL